MHEEYKHVYTWEVGFESDNMYSIFIYTSIAFTCALLTYLSNITFACVCVTSKHTTPEHLQSTMQCSKSKWPCTEVMYNMEVDRF